MKKKKNKTNEQIEDTKDQPSGKLDAQDLTTSSAPNSLSRRSFLERVSASTAVAATVGVGLPSLLSEKAKADDGEGPSRRAQSYRIRVRAANAERDIPSAHQINNGDERQYDNFIGNYSQGLPHNSLGEVDPTAYHALLTAVHSGRSSDFANIPLGGNAKLAGPQGGLAFDLEGTDSGQLTIPPSPALASAERAGEMVEDYWMALARDVPFSQYGNEPITAAAIADLNKLSVFTGPKTNGEVTANALFRGLRPGDLTGPTSRSFFSYQSPLEP